MDWNKVQSMKGHAGGTENGVGFRTKSFSNTPSPLSLCTILQIPFVALVLPWANKANEIAKANAEISQISRFGRISGRRTARSRISEPACICKKTKDSFGFPLPFDFLWGVPYFDQDLAFSIRLHGVDYGVECFRLYLLAICIRELSGDVRALAGASDFVQETLLAAENEREMLAAMDGPRLRAWLVATLRHRLVDAHRRRKVEHGATEHYRIRREIERADLPALVTENQLGKLEQCIDRLPSDYRRVIRLRHFESQRLGFDEIGRRLGDRSPDAARMLWVRAIEQLRTELGPSDEWL